MSQQFQSSWIKRLASGAALAALIAGGVFTTATPAAAQWYVEGQAGANIPGDSELDGTGFNVDAEIDTGPVGLLTIGYDY